MPLEMSKWLGFHRGNMSLTVKYFSFKDPFTGKQTKDLGFSVERTTRDFAMQLNAGKAIVSKNKEVSRVIEFRPKASDAIEVSKEIFDALDVSGESATSKRRRENNEIRIELATARENRASPKFDVADVVAKFEALSLVR